MPIIYINNDDIRLNSSSSDKVVVYGKLGIGTTSPGAELVIDSSNSYTRFFVQNAGSTKLEIGYGPTGYGFVHPTGQFIAYSDNLYFGQLTSLSASVSILSSGNVGIGTTSPTAKLHVSSTGETTLIIDSTSSGTARISLTGAGGGGGAITSTTSGLYLYASGANPISLNTNGSERLRVASDGNVGIGTTSPLAKLHIQGATPASSITEFLRLTGTSDQADNGIKIQFNQYTYGSQNDLGSVGVVREGANSRSSLVFLTNNSWSGGASSEKMRITGAGNVGIGTDSPSSGSRLQVEGNIFSNNVGGNSFSINSAGANYGFILNNSANTFSLGYGPSLGTVGSSVLTWNSSGNVGIGTTSPNAKLDVVGNTRLGSGTLHISTDQSFATSFTYSFRDAVGILNPNGTSAALGTAVMSIGGMSNGVSLITTGNVGIGTTSPSTRLHVNGGIITVNDGTGITYYEGVKIHSYDANGFDVIGREGLTLSTVSANKNIILSPTGNVGIGTTSPGAKLHVSGGEIRVDAGQAVTLDTSNNMYLVGSSSQLRIYNGGNPVVNITTGGNVGIGTTSPNQKLQVNGFVNANGYINSSTTFKKSFNIGNISSGTTFALGRLNFESVYTHHFRVTISSYYGSKTFDFVGYQATLDKSVSGIHGGGEVVVETILNVSNEVTGVKIGITTSVEDYVYTATIECLSTFLSWEDYSSSTTITPTTLGYKNNFMAIGGGNVGIGTTSPSQKLEVNGNIKLTNGGFIYGDGSNADLGLSNNNGSILRYGPVYIKALAASIKLIATSEEISLQNNNGTIWMNASGNVGIGTTSPGYKLDVSSDTNDGNIIRSTNLNAGAAASARFYAENNIGSLGQLTTYSSGFGFTVFDLAAGNFSALLSSGASSAGLLIGSLTSSPVVFGTNNTERMRITSGGNVGIGTTSPSYKLDVSGQIRVDNGVGNGSGQALVVGGSGDVTLSDGGSLFFGAYDYGGSTYIRGYDGGDIMYFYSNGTNSVYFKSDRAIFNVNVGIGTTSPAHKLHVRNETQPYQIALQSDTANYWQFGVGKSGYYQDWFLLANGSGDLIRMHSGYTNLRNSLWIDFSGNSTTLSTGGTALKLANTDTTVDNISAIDFPQSTAGSGFSRIGVIYKDRTASSEDQDMFFRTIGSGSSSEVMRLTSDGNVGIGTTSPGEKLSVNGFSYAYGAENVSGFKYENTTAGHVVIMNANDSYAQLYTTGATPLMLGTNNSVRAYITSDGKVGIGTTAPARTLSVLTTDTATYDPAVNAAEVSVTRANTSNVAGQVAGISLNATGWSGGTTGVVVLNAIQQQGNYSNADFAIQNRVGGSFVETFRITAYGDVGIGTAGPSSMLHIGTYGLAGKYVDSSTLPTTPANHLITLTPPSTAGYYGGGIAWSEGTKVAASINAYDAGSGGALGLVFATGNNTTLSERLRIDTDGNVGIGTTSPSEKLHIAGGTDAAVIRLQNTTSSLSLGDTIGAIQFYNSDTTDDSPNIAASIYATAGPSGGSGYLSFRTKEAGTEGAAATATMTLSNGGNVGIGTDSPSAKLHVAGSVRVTGTYLDVDANARITGNYYGNSGTEYTYLQMYNGSDASINIGTKHPLSYISFESGNGAYTERMRITNTGNVGIGITSPNGLFEVFQAGTGRTRGDLLVDSANRYTTVGRLSSTTSDNSSFKVIDRLNRAYFDVNTSTKYISFNPEIGDITMQIASGYGFKVNTSQFVVSATNGNVGIGATSPNAKLNLYDATEDVSINVNTGTSGSYPKKTGISFGATSTSLGGDSNFTGGAGIQAINTAATNNPTDLTFWTTYAGTPAEKMRISSAGNIEIKGASTTAGHHALIENTNTLLNIYGSSTGGTGKAITFWPTGASEAMRITSGGNIGINTTAPLQLLHIKGATEAFMMLEADNDTGIAGTYYKSEDTDGTMDRTKGFFGWQGETAYGNGYFTMWLDTAEDNGTVTSSEEKFRWERDGDFHADGDVIAYSTTTPSDARLKKDVSTIENASEKVAKLRGVEYTWNTGSREGKREIGLIAQEVETVVPEVVTERQLPLLTGTTEEYKTVDYERLIALLIESNKEMQKEIAELKSRLDGIAG